MPLPRKLHRNNAPCPPTRCLLAPVSLRERLCCRSRRREEDKDCSYSYLTTAAFLVSTCLSLATLVEASPRVLPWKPVPHPGVHHGRAFQIAVECNSSWHPDSASRGALLPFPLAALGNRGRVCERPDRTRISHPALHIRVMRTSQGIYMK